ncbi:MAG: hypothetical protein KatS3mg015_0995 [Fimbriimonadales bacterium]|nr:MAG: hypothetical protein KatS3mg015_0995 [Fimbriimonadales bacterium]
MAHYPFSYLPLVMGPRTGRFHAILLAYRDAIEQDDRSWAEEALRQMFLESSLDGDEEAWESCFVAGWYEEYSTLSEGDAEDAEFGERDEPDGEGWEFPDEWEAYEVTEPGGLP